MEHPHNLGDYEREGSDITASDMIVPEEDSDLRNFYENATIFITGATGFLGKLCMEKLLRACSVKKIYVLVRPKKGKDIDKRFEELFDEPSFEPLKRQKPHFREKVHVIRGDACLPDLGISSEDQEKLISEVDCIFHYAATVRFDEALRIATNINIRGTRDLLRISKRIKNLRAFVHVSTAFSNCVNNVIEEKFYKTPITGNNLIRLVDCLDDNQLNAITPALLGNYPNTYAFTKSIAEDVVKEEGDTLPIALLRPSIVVATSKEPVSGWIDNIYGATGVLVGVAVGLLRVLRGKFSNNADMVPADYVVNAGLATAWEIATAKTLNTNDEQSKEIKFDKEIPIYNYVSTPENPLTWDTFQIHSAKHASQVPSEKCIWYAFFFMIPNKYLYLIMRLLLHTVPAYIADFLAICSGRNAMLVKGYQKIHKFSGVIEYFTLRHWTFKNDNTQALWKKLKKQDKELFEFSMRSCDWDSFFSIYTKGVRVYILKDPLDTIPKGEIWYRKLKILHFITASISSILFCFISFHLLRFILKF